MGNIHSAGCFSLPANGIVYEPVVEHLGEGSGGAGLSGSEGDRECLARVDASGFESTQFGGQRRLRGIREDRRGEILAQCRPDLSELGCTNRSCMSGVMLESATGCLKPRIQAERCPVHGCSDASQVRGDQ
jgi:hypothetical protein